LEKATPLLRGQSQQSLAKKHYQNKYSIVMKDIEQYMYDDPTFAEEFIQSMQLNLAEFRESLLAAISNQEQAHFIKTHHKLKTTLSLIGNKKLIDQADIVLTLLTYGGGAGAITTRVQNTFCRLCNNMIEALSIKLKKIQTYKNISHENISV
jgi:hypothetical protein